MYDYNRKTLWCLSESLYICVSLNIAPNVEHIRRQGFETQMLV